MDIVPTSSFNDDEAWTAKAACLVKIGRNCDLGPKNLLRLRNNFISIASQVHNKGIKFIKKNDMKT